MASFQLAQLHGECEPTIIKLTNCRPAPNLYQKNLQKLQTTFATL